MTSKRLWITVTEGTRMYQPLQQRRSTTLIAMLFPAVLVSLATCGTRTHSELLVGRPLSSTIRRGESHMYQMRLLAGQYARIAAEQRDIDIQLEASGPAGFELPPQDGSEYGKEAISIVAPAAGSYVLRVRASERNSAAGVYTLALTDLRPARESDRHGLEAQRLFAGARELEYEDTESARATAIPLLVRAAELWYAAGDSLRQAQALHYLGRMYGRSQAFEKSDQAYRTALALWDELKDDAGRAVTRKAWINLGGHLGENRADQAALDELLGTWQKVGDRRGEAILVSSLSTLFRKSANYHRAIEYDLSFRSCLVVASTTIWRPSIRLVESNMACRMRWVTQQSRWIRPVR